MMKLQIFIAIFFMFCLISGYEYEVPSNFYGSPEVYSGFLSDQEEYIEAFTLKKDAWRIQGTVASINKQLSLMKAYGV